MDGGWTSGVKADGARVSGARTSGLARWLGVLKLSRRQLQQRWLESVLIVLGIGLGVSVLTTGETFVRFQNRMTVELVAGQIRQWEAVTVMPQARGGTEVLFGTDSVPAVRVSLEDLEAVPVRFSLEDLQEMRALPGVEYVTVQEGSRGSTIVSVEDVHVKGAPSAPPGAIRTVTEVYTPLPNSMFLEMEMVTPDEFAVLGYEFIAGGPFTWDDFREGVGRIVLERRSAERLFPDLEPAEMIGAVVTVASAGPSDSGRRVVVGIVELPEHIRMMMEAAMDMQGDNRFYGYAPATLEQPLRPRPGTAPGEFVLEAEAWEANRLYLSPRDEGLIADIVTEAQVYFDQKYGPGRVELRNPEAEREAAMGDVTGIVVALLVLAGLGLVIAAVNVLNLFTARVLRRMRITGMSVALGATRRLLFWQTAGEALLLGGSGSVLGVALAGGFVTVIRTMLSAQLEGELGPAFDFFGAFRVGPADAAVGIVAGVGLSLIFGLYPAWLGSRQNPVEALRVE